MKKEKELDRERWPDQKSRPRRLVALSAEKAAGTAAASMAAVHCPHYHDCSFGATRKRKSTPHCYGKLFGVSQNDSSLIVCYKCNLGSRKMLMVIREGKARHVQAETDAYRQLIKLMQPGHCHRCQRRILDYHHLYGDVVLAIKCNQDRYEGLYTLE